MDLGIPGAFAALILRLPAAPPAQILLSPNVGDVLLGRRVVDRLHMDDLSASGSGQSQKALHARHQRPRGGQVIAFPAAQACALDELVLHVDHQNGRVLRSYFLRQRIEHACLPGRVRYAFRPANSMSSISMVRPRKL